MQKGKQSAQRVQNPNGEPTSKSIFHYKRTPSFISENTYITLHLYTCGIYPFKWKSKYILLTKYKKCKAQIDELTNDLTKVKLHALIAFTH